MVSTFILSDLASTQHLAKQIAKIIVPNFVIYLNGNLGAGKTTLVRSILTELGVEGIIKSPTYTLVEEYSIVNDFSYSSCERKSSCKIFHFDLYRFNDAEEWFEAGFDEYFQQLHLVFIEWADKALAVLPKADWQLNLTLGGDGKRQVQINSQTPAGIACLKQLISGDVV